MGSKTATTSGTSNSSGSSTTTLSPQVQAAYNALLSQISGISSGTNTSTGTAASGLASLSATPNANYGTAANTLGSASAPAYQSINDYLSPYLTSGLSALQASQTNQNAQQQQQLVGNAISQGALGGNRVAVAQSNLAGQQALANNATNAAFVNNAYQQAENSALQGQSNQTAAGQAQGALGSSENASTLSNLLGLLSAGNSQYSNLGTLGSLASNLSNSGATVSTNSQSSGTSTVPVGNTFSSLLGGLTSIAGLFRDGGVVPRRYDVGGSISELAQSANSGMDQSQQLMQSLMQNAQSAANQQNQQPQYTDEQKKGAANIGNWAKGLFPQNDNAMPAMYASGGVIPFRRRGYDDGGYVDFPYADFGDTNSQIVNAPAGVLPALVGNSDVTVPSNYIVAPSVQGMIDQVTPQPGVLASPSLLRDTPTDNPATRQDARDQAMADQGFPGQSSGVIPARTIPLTVATNNPGAITNGPWAASQPGYVGARGDFAVFDSPEAGRNAQVGLLSNYADKGYNTIASVINRWSPQTANARGSTANYIDYVSQRTGLAPNQPIPPGRLGDVAQAQSEWESGLKPGGFVPPAPGGVVPSAQGTQGAGTPAIQSPAVSGVIPTQYGIQDSNAGYATNLGDVFKSLQEGKGFNLSPDARMALISAGAGMMAGTSPNAFANIGSGIQQGLDTWQKKQELNRENALAQSGIGAQQGELGLEGQKVQQAGQQLYLAAQQTAAQIAQETAAAAQTNVEAAKARFVPTPVGMMQYDPENPNAAPKVIPWNQLQGAAGSPGQASGVSTEQPKPDADGFVTTAPPATTINPMLMSQSSAPIVYEQTKTALGGAQGDAINAQALNAQLGELANLAQNMPDTGPLASGAAFDQRLSAVKGINGFLQTIGAPQIDPKDVATAEGMKKLATQLQFAVADAVKTDPAAMTIAQAASASPSGENTKQGFARIVGNIEALNKRSIDRFNFLQSWANQHYGDTTGADATFNQLNPPEKYIAYGDKLAEGLGAAPASQSIPTVTTQKAYDALPSGSVYIAPDGKQHRKQ